MGWLSLLIEPFTYSFMLQAFLIASLTGIACAIFSCFLVLKSWSLMGDALSHAVLPGIVVAFAIGIPLIIGAFISGILCSLASGYIKTHCRVKEDTVMGIIFSGMFALGLVMFSFINTDQHLSHILFGNILGITHTELVQIIIISPLASILILIKKQDLILYCFDPIQARVIGLPVKLIHYGLLSILALTIVISLQVAGVVLVIAMFITPGITGFILTKNFRIMLFIALCVSVISCIIGTMLSFYIDGATGPTIVITQASFFILAQSKVWLNRILLRNKKLIYKK